MNDHPPLRRAAPPARPHPIAGYRAQHHHHSQRAIQAAGIDPLELQRGLHPTNAFARLDHNTLSRILSFISPIQLLTTLNRTSKTLNRLINQHDNHLLWNTKLDWLTHNLLTSDRLSSIIININPESLLLPPPPPRSDDNLENLFSDPLLGSPFQQDGQEEEDLLSFDPAPSSQYPSIYPGKITNTTKARILTYKPHHHHHSKATTRNTTDYRARFLAYYRSLLPYLDSLIEHSTDSLVFLVAGLSPLQRAELLAVLSRLLRNPALAPPRLLLNKTLHDNLNKAICAFHRALYNHFSRALNSNRLSDLNTLASVNAALPPLLPPSSRLGIPDIARCFIDKRVIFEHQPFNPLDNLRKREGLKGEQIEGVDFSAMARFFEYLSETIEREGGLIQRIFPKQMNVLERLISRILDEVIQGYVGRLLTAVQSLPSPLFQITNVEVYRHLKGLVEVTKKVEEDGTGRTTGRVEEMIQRMFGAHLAVYLDEELRFVKGALEQACFRWQEAGELMEGSQVGGGRGGAGLRVPCTSTTDGSLGTKTKTAVLRSFKNALLLPVSVVPKTVSYSFNALSNVGLEAFHSVTHALILPSTTSIHTHGPLSTDYRHAKILRDQPATLDSELESWLDCSPPNPSLLLPTPSSSSSSNPMTHPSLINPKSTLTNRDQKQEEDELDDRDRTEPDDELSSLLSLDLVLQLISINQLAIQRLHSFLPFAPLQSLNLQIVNTVHQVFVLLLHSLTHHHIQPGFEKYVFFSNCFFVG
ncbi:F-box protein: endocytic membrane traffic, recycling ReCYcling 1 [Puccinia graminis f. sp. tritici]|uniref:F-box protein: endocytic membrane traffic, recycling ReCYcling 1 n=1 Tax=Puccinia graminis f. sp. tritici TaxID=56615 RepID=A0A5B0PGN0_PUCGR|nr:F-box protein: endocytic membrane traffic, recycling ReCYcling 1 [Puccinia graminis f. sp. tritici]